MKQQAKEIIWNLVNSLLAGLLIFLGALTTGDISRQVLIVASIASAVVFVTKFKEYWHSEQEEWAQPKSIKMFDFL